MLYIGVLTRERGQVAHCAHNTLLLAWHKFNELSVLRSFHAVYGCTVAKAQVRLPKPSKVVAELDLCEWVGDHREVSAVRAATATDTERPLTLYMPLLPPQLSLSLKNKIKIINKK